MSGTLESSANVVSECYSSGTHITQLIILGSYTASTWALTIDIDFLPLLSGWECNIIGCKLVSG